MSDLLNDETYRNISKTDKKVVVELNSDDLVNICNSLYATYDRYKKNPRFLQLYSDLVFKAL